MAISLNQINRFKVEQYSVRFPYETGEMVAQSCYPHCNDDDLRTIANLLENAPSLLNAAMDAYALLVNGENTGLNKPEIIQNLAKAIAQADP